MKSVRELKNKVFTTPVKIAYGRLQDKITRNLTPLSSQKTPYHIYLDIPSGLSKINIFSKNILYKIVLKFYVKSFLLSRGQNEKNSYNIISNFSISTFKLQSTKFISGETILQRG